MDTMIRQGDVLLRSIENLLQGATVRDEPGIKIAGERTGHAHRLMGIVFVAGARTLIRVSGLQPMTQEEHADVTPPAGLFEVVQQREYVPAARPRSRRFVD